jgi:predicted Zn-dependent protease
MAAVPKEPADGDDLPDFVRAFRNAPESMAYWPLAAGRLAAGRFTEAVVLLRHGLERHPEHLASRLALARALLAQAAWTEAVAELQSLVAAQPEHAGAHLLLAEALDAAGDGDGARGALERACALAPDDELAALLLGQLRAEGTRRLGKVAIGKRKASGAVEERRRKPDARAEEDSPSKPPRVSYQPENPFAPLPDGDWSWPPGGSDLPAGAAPLKSGSKLSAVRPATAAPPAPEVALASEPPRARPRWLLLVVIGVGAAALLSAGAWWLLRSELDGRQPATARAPAPPDLAPRLARGAPADYAAVRDEARGVDAAVLRAEALALDLVDYGNGDPAAVEAALGALASADGQSGAAVARVALLCARIPEGGEDELAQARAAVDRALGRFAASSLLHWLDGVVAQSAGDRAGARAAYTLADAHGSGPVQAQVALADLAFDDGDLDGALAGYQAALGRVPGHPWALVGRARVGVERGAGGAAAILADLDEAGRAGGGPRVTVWAALVRARATGQPAPDAVDPGRDARLEVEQALLRADRGAIVDAARLRARLGKGDAELLAPLEATLLLARGHPGEARAALGARADRRARFLRARAWLDDGRAEEAAAELHILRGLGPDDAVAAFDALAQATRVGGNKDALASLELLAAGPGAGAAQLALGEALAADGDEERARKALDAVPAGGPWAFRARVRRAEVELASYARTHDPHRLSDADAAVREALEQAPDYLPARAVVGRILMAKGQPEGALAAFGPVIAADRDGPLDDLALAQAYAAGGDLGRARDAVRSAVRKGASPKAVRAAAELVDPHNADNLAGGH